MVTVSQTKIGACLQFQSSAVNLGLKGYQLPDSPVYCSVDIVPKYAIIGVEALELARIVNFGELKIYLTRGNDLRSPR